MQPKWKIIGRVGDIDPVEYGGGWVKLDLNNRYDPEMEIYVPELGAAYQIILERQEVTPEGFLMDAGQYQRRAGLLYPLEQYESWFSENLDQPAACYGLDVAELRRLLCSLDVMEVAYGYECLIGFYGYDEFDGYPVPLTRAQARERYSGWEVGKTFHV